MKDLRGLARRPMDFQARHGTGLAQADGLLERVAAEAAAARDVAVDGERLDPALAFGGA